MRIGLVVHDYSRTGGHSRYVAELATRFARAHEVHVFANTFSEPLPTGATAHRVPALRRTALTTVLTFAAARPARASALDIVHAQGFCGAPADVLTAHICNARWLEVRRRADGTLPFRDRVFAGAVVPLERRAFADERVVVIAVSEAIRRDLAHHYGRRAPTIVIPHAVDTAQFNPGDAVSARGAARAQYRLPDDAFVILYVGDLRKGAAHVIETAARVPGTMVLLVSRTDPRPYLERAAALGLERRVVATGPTETVERAYAAADVFLFPTPYDAFGMVITEAMASGLPVITTRDAGASELITHDVDGLLLDRNDDVGTMAAWVTALRDDGSRRSALGRAAAARAATMTWDGVAQRTLAVYEQTLETRGATQVRR